jgi:hypothetical protein
VLRILSLSDLKPLEIELPWIGFGLRRENFPSVLRSRLQVEDEFTWGGGRLGPRGRCDLLGTAQGWHGGVDILHEWRGGWARGGVLPVPMATRPIAGPTVMHWSRPRQEVGQGRPSPTGSSRPA